MHLLDLKLLQYLIHFEKNCQNLNLKRIEEQITKLFHMTK
jgi:hypothetical protein